MINKNFYPTPAPLAREMAHRISDEAKYILDPEAGSGALLDAVRRRFSIGDTGRNPWGGRHEKHLYAIEIDQDLVATLHGKAYEVIGYDFLTYEPDLFFDAIIMNPPFDAGEDHLLHALDILRGGEIVCLLNAETIANPCTAKRRLLKEKLDALGAEIKNIGHPFTKAERRTDVEVVIVYMLKEAKAEDGFEYWSGLAEEGNSGDEDGVTYELTKHDQIEAIVSAYGEVQRCIKEGMRNIQRAFYFARGIAAIQELAEHAIDPLANLDSPRAAYAMAVNGFMDGFRASAWKAVFDRTGADKLMSRKVKEEFSNELQRGSAIAFTVENIKSVVANLYEDAPKIISDSVLDVFDHLCSFDPKNKVHVEGWKTNSAYKVNRRVIIPWAISYNSYFTLNYHRDGEQLLEDLDRILVTLSGKKDAVGVVEALRKRFEWLNACNRGRGRGHTVEEIEADPFNGEMRCESEFFNLRFYMKGTLHLHWKDEGLWARFNLEAARGRAWVGDDAKSEDEYTKRLRIGAA